MTRYEWERRKLLLWDMLRAALPGLILGIVCLGIGAALVFARVASGQTLPAPGLTAEATSSSSIELTLTYDWEQVPLEGGEQYGFELERAECLNPDCEPSGPGPFVALVPTPPLAWYAILGDCEFDRTVDLFDILRASDLAVGLLQPKPSQVALCNANCAGTTDLFDVLLLVDDVLGVVEIPLECLAVARPVG